MDYLNYEKRSVAKAAISFVEPGMVLRLGSGSTITFFIQFLGEAIKDGLSVTGVSSSENTTAMAKICGIPLLDLHQVEKLDLTIDGADEFDEHLRLIKGGGGALLREKILAYNSNYNIIIADSSKEVQRLGKFRLPIEVIPFAKHQILTVLQAMGLNPKLRQSGFHDFVTDGHHNIIDINVFGQNDLVGLNNFLIDMPGIVETGLFLNTTDKVIVGRQDQVDFLTKKSV